MIKKTEHRTPKCMVRSSGVAAGVVLGLMWWSPLPSQAATYTVLYSFTGKPNDGALGLGGNGSLVQDDAGNLFGTTQSGGPYDFGTAFKLDSANKETVLANFDYTNGVAPMAGLIKHRGILYDTVNSGGYANDGGVVKINGRGKATLLYSFCSLANCADGQWPQYGVTSDSVGNLYGTAIEGGAYNAGVVFKVDSAGKETVLYSFCPSGQKPCPDGGFPISGAIRDSAGNLYGVAQQGTPNSRGVVWKLDTSGKESVLYAFKGSPDGLQPQGLLTIDGNGNLYGITNGGGSSGTACGYGCGTVFKVDPNGNETVLHNFTGGTDGSSPGGQALVLDNRGNLYGTAYNGGAYGYGTVFRLSTSGKFKVLYAFRGQSDGGYPAGDLLSKHGVLYGEASIGGDLNCGESSGVGCGVVFKITR